MIIFGYNVAESLGLRSGFLLQTRLERISDGCMEFINPQLIECLVCNMTYMLHRPFNMCRAIRHLRSKHPDLMPEFAPTTDSVR